MLVFNLLRLISINNHPAERFLPDVVTSGCRPDDSPGCLTIHEVEAADGINRKNPSVLRFSILLGGCSHESLFSSDSVSLCFGSAKSFQLFHTASIIFIF